jgi:hypothetical protein
VAFAREQAIRAFDQTVLAPQGRGLDWGEQKRHPVAEACAIRGELFWRPNRAERVVRPSFVLGDCNFTLTKLQWFVNTLRASFMV